MEEKRSELRRLLKFWRPALIAALLLIPVILLVAVGSWALWRDDQWRWLLWVTPLCWAVGYFLLRWWNRRLIPPWEHNWESTRHWTPRDQGALEIVADVQKRSGQLQPEQLVDPHFYLQTSMDLALRIARHYHPKTQDPLSSLTIPEIMAAAQLAIEDSAEWIQKYVPGSSLLSVRQWRALAQAPRWMKLAADATWAVSLLFNPSALGRYVASRVTMDSASKRIQTNVLEAFYQVFVHSVGQYLIEMNSGRLRGGARKYREAFARLRDEAREEPARTGDGEPAARETARPRDVVTIALIGQRGAGKSSLIQAMAAVATGAQVHDEQRPASGKDSLPVHELTLTHSSQQVHVIDTPGYSAAESTPAEQARIHEAARRADIVLVVMKATSPARQADLQTVEETLKWFAEQPRLKPPLMLGVLTHIDGLSPMLEWAPPYQWQQPARPKEHSIHQAVTYAQELFGPKLKGVVPVCVAPVPERVFGIEEALIPAMISLLGDARAGALLRTLHAEIDDARLRTVLHQLRNVGRGLLESFLKT